MSLKAMNSSLTTAWVIVALIVGLLLGAAIVAALSTDVPVAPVAAPEVWLELDTGYELGLRPGGGVIWRKSDRPRPIIPRPRPGTGDAGAVGSIG